jgi:hypothetical protein
MHTNRLERFFARGGIDPAVALIQRARKQSKLLTLRRIVQESRVELDLANCSRDWSKAQVKELTDRFARFSA